MKSLSMITLVLMLLFSGLGFGQQDPHYSQYMYNMNVINPAYAGSKEVLSITALGRIQWANIDGAPKTFTLTMHAPLGKNLGAGLSVIADEIGPVKEQNIFADFSYTVRTSENGKLAFGLKAGFTLHNLDALALTTIDPESLSDLDLQNKAFPNIGAGAFYYTDRFYVGLSLPNFLETKHFENQSGITKASEKAHYFLTSGYVFELSESLKLKPSIMAKATPGAPLSVDVSGNVLINNKLELGASYRWDDAIIGLVNFSITDDFRIGYAYDYTLSNLGDFNSGSHEVFLLWDLDFSRSAVISPRFF